MPGLGPWNRPRPRWEVGRIRLSRPGAVAAEWLSRFKIDHRMADLRYPHQTYVLPPDLVTELLHEPHEAAAFRRLSRKARLTVAL